MRSSPSDGRKGARRCTAVWIAVVTCLGVASGWTVAEPSSAAQAAAVPRATRSVVPTARAGHHSRRRRLHRRAGRAGSRRLYQEHCLSCHGSSLRGGTNEFAAPALAGPFFFDAWGGRPVAELLAYSTDNMPPEGTLLPEPDYVDVTAYILQVLGYPEGDAELTPDSPALAAGIERQR